MVKFFDLNTSGDVPAAPVPSSSPAVTADPAKRSENPYSGTRIVFMGTPALSANLLSTLLEYGYNIVGVVTKPDKPSGRSQTLAESPVKVTARKHGLPVLTPTTLDDTFLDELKSLSPDLVIVLAYGKILPKDVLKLPHLGCLNIHGSLLPRFRGASPIQNALLSGDSETGVTLMLMDETMDTGPIIAQEKFPINPDATAEDLRALITRTGANLLLEKLPLWIDKKIEAKPQDNAQATLCQLIEREDGHIVWSESAESIYNRYRALYPWPGIYTFLKKNDALLRFKLLKISFQKQSPQVKYPLGQVIEMGDKIGVQTGEGVIFLESVQLEGKSALTIREYLSGSPDLVGSIFH